MLIRRLQQRIEELRQQPEHVRLQAATRYTIIAGIVLLVLWLTVFLPLQLRGIFGDSSSTVTPLPSLIPTP